MVRIPFHAATQSQVIKSTDDERHILQIIILNH